MVESEEFNEAVIGHVEGAEDLMRARDTLFALLLTTAGAGLAQAAGEELLIAHLGAMDDAVELGLVKMDDAHWSSLPPTEAISYFRKKKLVTQGELAELEDSYGARGFSVAGLKQRFQLERVHGAISRALEEGTTREAFVKEMRPLFDKWGVTAGGPHYLETVFDTNVAQAYAAGRYQQMTRPDVLAARPFWKYTTAGDYRVRATHKAMDGKVIPADSPIWDEWYPPNGYRCRCSVVSLSQRDVEREGSTIITELPQKIETKEGQVFELMPDSGFSGSPRTQARADIVVERIRKKTAASEMLRAPDLQRTDLPKVDRRKPKRTTNPEGVRREADAVGPKRAPIFNSAGDLLRSDDARRNAKVDAFSGLSSAKAEELAQEQLFFNLFPNGELGRVPEGETWVEIPIYSQNLDTAEQLIKRLAAVPKMGHLADSVELVSRASYGDYDTAAWADPEVAWDRAGAARLGRPEQHAVSRSTEMILRLVVRDKAELRAAQTAALQSELNHRGKVALRRAWDVADIRVRGAMDADSRSYREAYLNRRDMGNGEQVVLTKGAPIEGWESEPVQVNKRLHRFLPSYPSSGKGGE